MSKYDFAIDLSQNSSTGMILGKVARGSQVLEFGCAAGRMTRYMKENLSCRVSIVEYDPSAFESAMQYAEDGLCDDIQTMTWVEKYAGRKFDAILFVDVLEHLQRPEEVLARAADYLAEDGKIYLSIPNLTHNDVLIKACSERFDYTPTGLLDESHIHFWGMENIAETARKCGLTVRSLEGTWCASRTTEQAMPHKKPGLLESLLLERQCGEVYQFIVALDKDPAPGEEPVFRRPALKCSIYLDRGRGMNDGEKIVFDAPWTEAGCFHAHHIIQDPENIRRIRFDPVEGWGCLIRNVNIIQGGRPLVLSYSASLQTGRWTVLLGDDPMIYTENLTGSEAVEVQADIVLPGERYISVLREEYEDMRSQNQQLSTDLYHAGETVDELNKKQHELEKNIDALQLELDKCRRDMDAYVALAYAKESYALQTEKKLQEKEAELARINHSLPRRVGAKLRRIPSFVKRKLKGLKRRLKKLIGRG